MVSRSGICDLASTDIATAQTLPNAAPLADAMLVPGIAVVWDGIWTCSSVAGAVRTGAPAKRHFP